MLERAGIFWEQSVENLPYSKSLNLKPVKCALFKRMYCSCCCSYLFWRWHF